VTDVSDSDILKRPHEIVDAMSGGELVRLTKQRERLLGMRSTFYLCKYILQYNKLSDDFHRKACAFHDKYIRENQLHLHPRGNYKTTMFTVAGSIRLILLDPDLTILIRTNTEDNAKEFMGEIKRHFTSNEKFRALYPEHAINSRRQEGPADKVTTPARTKAWIRSPSIQGASISQRLVSRHYLHIKFDDIADQDNTATPDLRYKTRQIYNQSLSLCDGLTPGKLPWHHVVGTRWHLDDVYHHLIEVDRDKEIFKKLITSSYYTVLDPQTGAEQKKLLFPEEFSWERLEYIRETYERDGSNLFACLYLNDPVPGDEASMNPRYLQYFNPESDEFKQKKHLTHIITVDPSPAESPAEGDPGVVTAASMDENKNIYIREVRRGWWKLHETVEVIVDVYQRYRPYRIGIEAVAFQKWLGQELKFALMEKGIHADVFEIKRDPRQTKPERQKKLLFPLRAGRLHVRVDEPEMRNIKIELRGYPKGRFDDILDTFTDVVEYLEPPFVSRNENPHSFRMPPIQQPKGVNFQTGRTFRAV